MKVLDVGCGVGGPAREIAKFTGCHVTGLNNNDYQIERADVYAKKEGLDKQLSYVKGDFMVRSLGICSCRIYVSDLRPANEFPRQQFRCRVRH